MNEPQLDNLESRLRDATTWTGPTTQLWKRALATQAKPSISSFGVIAFAKRRWFPLVSGIAAASLAFALFLSSQSGAAPFTFPAFNAGHVTEEIAGETLSAASQPPASWRIADSQRSWSSAIPTASPPVDLGYDSFGEAWPLVRASGTTRRQFNSPSQTDTPDRAKTFSPVASQRHVIQKATLELSTPDVRAAFLKAGLILNEALGEHVQDSSLTGSGETASATFTLRVAASRLSEVSNALRELGTVVSEHREGQDVTGQVIDVEARLRNEQRVEQELLALFDQRKDAPLKDVLDLRQKLSEVRSGIEQLVGQRDQLSRLVSLATVLVIIRTCEKPAEPPKEDGLWTYFRNATTHAWRSGLRGLADTIAALLAIFIGGLIWWVLLAIALLLLRRYVRGRGGKA